MILLHSFLFAFLISAEPPQKSCETPVEKESALENYLVAEEYDSPSIYSFIEIIQENDVYEVRFDVNSGQSYGESFDNPGNCIGKFMINNQCQIEEKGKDTLTASGVVDVKTECYEIENEH